MANPPSKPPRGVKTPKETVSTYLLNTKFIFHKCTLVRYKVHKSIFIKH